MSSFQYLSISLHATFTTSSQNIMVWQFQTNSWYCSIKCEFSNKFTLSHTISLHILCILITILIFSFSCFQICLFQLLIQWQLWWNCCLFLPWTHEWCIGKIEAMWYNCELPKLEVTLCTYIYTWTKKLKLHRNLDQN